MHLVVLHLLVDIAGKVVLALPCEAFGSINRVAPDSMDLPVAFSVEEWFNVPDKLREKPSRSALVMVSELQRSG